jgi:hypothetical protein
MHGRWGVARPDWLSAPGFGYVGPVAFELYDARVVRHHYVDAEDGRVRRQLIVQLEGFPQGSDRSYRWQVEHPLRLGGIDHEHGVYAWSVASEVRSDPLAEVARSAAFLADHGYEQGDGQLMARFARVVGTTRQCEVIVFYQEDLADLGLAMHDVADEDGDLRPQWARLGEEVTARSLAAFEVADLARADEELVRSAERPRGRRGAGPGR